MFRRWLRSLLLFGVVRARSHHARAAAAVASALLFGCGDGSGGRFGIDGPTGGPAGSRTSARTPWIYAPLGVPTEPSDNPSTEAKVDLGRLLFHDPVLSGDRATACVTCHSQYWGMGDGLRRGIGVGGTGPAGIGREGSTSTRRNVPTLWNAAYRTTLFWDGRVPSLERQVEVPLRDERELGADPEKIIGDIAASTAYRALFAAAFPDAAVVSLENIARAIASFVRTIVSVDAPYDRYARGDDAAMTAPEIRGMHLFAELGCATCHTPPLFGADRFDAVPLASSMSDDLGRFEVTGAEEDRHAFRVPQLRNLRETGPYFHDGHAPTMKQALHEMITATSPRAVGDDELHALAEFVGKALMDKACLPERPLTVPSGLPVPADGFAIRR